MDYNTAITNSRQTGTEVVTSYFAEQCQTRAGVGNHRSQAKWQNRRQRYDCSSVSLPAYPGASLPFVYSPVKVLSTASHNSNRFNTIFICSGLSTLRILALKISVLTSKLHMTTFWQLFCSSRLLWMIQICEDNADRGLIIREKYDATKQITCGRSWVAWALTQAISGVQVHPQHEVYDTQCIILWQLIQQFHWEVDTVLPQH